MTSKRIELGKRPILFSITARPVLLAVSFKDSSSGDVSNQRMQTSSFFFFLFHAPLSFPLFLSPSLSLKKRCHVHLPLFPFQSMPCPPSPVPFPVYAMSTFPCSLSSLCHVHLSLSPFQSMPCPPFPVPFPVHQLIDRLTPNTHT